MQIIFANIVLASEFSDGGTDAMTGFRPKGKGTSQKAGWMRAPYETVFARSNRLITLQGVIRPAPAPTLAEAMIALETLYASLPDQGDLVKKVSGASVTYPNATLDAWEALEDLNGASYGYRLTFLAGKPTSYDPTSETSDVITDPGGAAITDPSGQPLTDP